MQVFNASNPAQLLQELQLRFGIISGDITRRFVELTNATNVNVAIEELTNLDKLLHIHDLNLTGNDAYFREFAKHQIDKLKANHTYAFALELLNNYQLSIPTHVNEQGLLARLKQPRFWQKLIKKRRAENIEHVSRQLGIIQNNKSAYASNVNVSLYKQELAKQKEFLESHCLENPDGEKVKLSEIALHNVSNPEIRRAELMVRARGFEELANTFGLDSHFLTLTLPPQFHCTRKNGSDVEHYDGSTIREAQNKLQHIWDLVKAKLDRNKVKPFGFRVAEPHHDGTPHWHFLLFASKQDLAFVEKTFAEYCEKECGYHQYQLKVVSIDKDKGSASGYIAKYIAKNIDGAFLDEDLYGNDAKASAVKVQAWARAHRIRQFQQVGGASVSVWRELRKLKYSCNRKDMELARIAADSSDWAAFNIAMGAVNTPKKQHLIQPYYESNPREEIDFETGEVCFHDTNDYGEPLPTNIKGLTCHDIVILTRTGNWKLLMEPPENDDLPSLHPPPARARDEEIFGVRR